MFDVLAVRTADAVAAWLGCPSEIRIVSRDRHGPYADAARRTRVRWRIAFIW